MSNVRLDRDQEMQSLRDRLAEAEDIIRAIRAGEIDAVVVNAPDSPIVYSIKNADSPYRLLVEQMQEGALTVSHDGVILFCNAAFARTVRLPTERLRGALLTDFIPDLAQLSPDDLMSGRDLHLYTSNGETRNVFVSSTPLNIDGERLHCVVVTDLTRQELRRQLDPIVNSSADAIYSLNLEGEITTWNRAAEQLYGHSTKEAVGRNVKMLFPAGEQFAAERIPARLLETKLLREDTKQISKSGKSFDVALSLAAIESLGGDIEGVSVIARDISARKRVEKALEQSEERLRLALEGAQLGVFSYDVETDKVWWDDRTRQLFGTAPSEAGFSVERMIALVHREDREAVRKEVSRSLDPTGDGTYRIEHRIDLPRGSTRWVSVHGQTEFVGEGAERFPVYAHGVVRDVTSSKDAEEHRDLLVAELNHRVRNTLTLIQAIARQTLRNSSDIETFGDKFVGRLHAIAAAHEILTTSNCARADLAVLIDKQVGPYAGPDEVACVSRARRSC